MKFRIVHTTTAPDNFVVEEFVKQRKLFRWVWLWQPVGRYNGGYFFAAEYTSKEDAKRELRQLVKRRQFKEKIVFEGEYVDWTYLINNTPFSDEEALRLFNNQGVIYEKDCK